MSSTLENQVDDELDEDANVPVYALVDLGYALRDDLTPSQRCLLLILTFYCGVANKWVGPLEDLAYFMGQSVKQTRADIMRLEEVKVIRVDRRAGQPSRYSILERYGYVDTVFDREVRWHIPPKTGTGTDPN